MRKYEAVFILRSGLKEEEINSVADRITEPIIKNKGTVSLSEVWLNKKKFAFPIKKHREGLYYRINFTTEPKLIDLLKQSYRLNEDILRLVISNLEGH